ncbi:DUF2490 domain-containing protein [Spirosoma taeanense]|uniref:DUF2490 domain-containing protein n=1 Tax=Spirosoma taeanense TaxID=2735870 RepID=A0A6M5Y7H0_9BACT|nr:DUF2490 domain-containing protein [Spirosoma taeanense]QJW88662.1 DUF2490 domain-containing protein [Spirosoma taeanense]
MRSFLPKTSYQLIAGWAGCLLQLLLNQAFAQVPKVVQPSNQVWTAFYHQTRLSDKWGLWFDVQARRTDFMDRWATLIFRPGVVYHLSDDARLMAGYAYARFYPAEPQNDVQPEHRPWQQLNWEGKHGRIETNHWVRVEERFRGVLENGQLQPGYTFNWRFRVMVSGQVPLWGDETRPGVPAILLQNELWIQAGKRIVYNHFDQNRLFLGLVYPFSKQFRAQAGYQNVFQQEAIGNRFQNKHTLRVFLYHSLDLRKKS